MKKLLYSLIIFIPFIVNGQMMYQDVTNKNLSLGSYGRIGVDWSFENGGSIGRRLNLNNMGSIGGRLEEQDYLELVPALHFKPFKDSDSTIINVQLRFAVYSQSLSLFGNSTTNSIGGLTIAIPEMYAEAKNIAGKELNMWVGARLYRGPDVHIADHFYFNDHSGQGFGIEFKKTRFSTLFISSTDTSATVPPYFYLNIATGTPSLALRQRTAFILEQDIILCKKQTLTLLGEYHHMGSAAETDTEIPDDSIGVILNYPSDYGYVIGARLSSDLNGISAGSFNKLAVRYGARIANGGDGGMSRTWLTFGAPDLEKENFNGAYSISLVDEVLLNINDRNSINAYIIYTYSKGGADTDGLAKTYFDREVYNRKQDLTLGLRDIYYFSDIFHLMGEVHYSQRKDGVDKTNSVIKFSLAPMLVPTGEKSMWARPQLRFVTSIARYNDAAMKNLYSPYLQFVGEKRWGYYLGVKAEWWIW